MAPPGQCGLVSITSNGANADLAAGGACVAITSRPDATGHFPAQLRLMPLSIPNDRSLRSEAVLIEVKPSTVFAVYGAQSGRRRVLR